MDTSRRGGFVVGGDDWEEYLSAPHATYHEEPPAFAFVVPMTQGPTFEVPTFVKPQGNNEYFLNSQSGYNFSESEKIVIKKGKPKGLVLDLRRHKLNTRASLPTPTAP